MALQTVLPTGASAPVVALYQGKPITISQDVAAYFGKRHDDVLRAIRKLCPQISGQFADRNFAVSEYTDSTGRTLPSYRITRDGFTLLAMGFTGRRALEFKLAYIDAFNRMEAELQASASTDVNLDIQRVTQTFENSRFFLSFPTDGRPLQLKPIPDGTCVLDPKDERAMVDLMREIVPLDLLPAMMTAALERIGRRLKVRAT